MIFLAIAAKECQNTNDQVPLVSLSALPNLEFLKIEHIKPQRTSFDGLEKLVKLDLIKCDLSDLDFEASSCFDNLKVLKINKATSLFPIKV